MAGVDGYFVEVFGGPNGREGLRASILLLAGSAVRAFIHFHKAGDPLPPDTRDGPHIHMHLPEARFDSIIDLLRNERPLFIMFGSGFAYLTTSPEPIGEGEA
jgi:hypothetical protein